MKHLNEDGHSDLGDVFIIEIGKYLDLKNNKTLFRAEYRLAVFFSRQKSFDKSELS